MAPYRDAAGAETLEASTRDGVVKLELAPRSAVLELVGIARLTITEGYVAVQSLVRRRRPRSYTLDGRRLLVARAEPTDEIGVWYEVKPEVMRRIFGLRPPELLDRDAFEAWKKLDRLYTRLCQAAAGDGSRPTAAIEYGRGADRVLVTDDGHRYVVYVRRLFRERPRRAIEIGGDGTLRLPAGRQARIESRFGVTVSGDAIRFADRHGQDLARLWLPWITLEERQALARRLGERVDQQQQASDSTAEH